MHKPIARKMPFYTCTTFAVGLAAQLQLMHSLALTDANPPSPGQWSAAHDNAWCNGGLLLKDLGTNVSLASCQAACAEAAACNYVCHAVATDLHCYLYTTCPKPTCWARTGWIATYEFGQLDRHPTTKHTYTHNTHARTHARTHAFAHARMRITYAHLARHQAS